MSDLSIYNAKSGGSPFDAIRGYREDGSEYWTGRELMRFLGYVKWQKFGGKEEDRLSVIEKAILSCQNSGNAPEQHFTRSGKLLHKPTPAHPVAADDWELSRYACYLIAMCGDPAKDEVAAAQRYFAIKIREAEVIIPAQSEALEILKLQNENLKLELQLRNAEQKLIDTRHLITATCPEVIQQKILGYQVIEKVEYRDRVIHNDDVIRDGTTINKTSLCRRYGLLKAGKVQYKQINQLLEKLPLEAFRLTAIISENNELLVDFLPQLDRIFQTEIRQLNLGEE